ncbi:cytochrome c1 [Asticcacaulis sp. AC402]|uniref:cytochrome c1 n=1 Tax=Asticcacaulis sp. AC402 TaxID=1282361 RepID=UPI0003C3DA87|nr:cytochrome c1 [Asticcacaulis sp. AC402]ESQ74793.1 ubiquinol cytochrome C oxidoreductase [Asticcacaulis sp. AC402]
MTKSLKLLGGLAVAATLGLGMPALAAGGHAKKLQEAEFSFEGPFGTFDQAELQRGYKVYREVCASCHAMNLMSFRNLGQKGGPFYDERYSNPNDNPVVKQIASEFEVAEIDPESGDEVMRKATTSDRFPSPFRNDEAAKASNGGALPPDLSVMAKARHDGANYIYSLLQGYDPEPHGLTVAPGQHYNVYFPGDLTSAWTGDHDKVPAGGVLAMAAPLSDGRVTFDDGTPSTLKNQSRAVAAFIAWTSEPHAIERKQTGVAVLLYLLIFFGITYLAYRQVWRGKH